MSEKKEEKQAEQTKQSAAEIQLTVAKTEVRTAFIPEVILEKVIRKAARVKDTDKNVSISFVKDPESGAVLGAKVRFERESSRKRK